TRQELGAGRVILRITSEAAYPSLGVRAGVNYVWVDSLTGRFRALVFSDDPRQPPLAVPLGLRQHALQHPVAARFVEGPFGMGVWMPCPRGCCCMPEPICPDDFWPVSGQP
ncbi:MAG: hypothetical protein ACREN5_02240, partial [Gemmatimonadales bacterium]